MFGTKNYNSQGEDQRVELHLAVLCSQAQVHFFKGCKPKPAKQAVLVSVGEVVSGGNDMQSH